MIIVDTKYSVSDEAAERLARACSLIASGMINELPLSRTEIEGSDIYVNVSEYKTHELNNSLWEAHRKYADIHYVIDGTEQIACAPSDAMTVTQEYSDATDAVLGVPKEKLLTLKRSICSTAPRYCALSRRYAWLS
jgi:YhcH/YjgK/YiaL family protein